MIMTNSDTNRLQLSYIYGGIVQYRPGEELAPRTLPDYELVVLIEGQARYLSDGTDYTVPPGGVILARPGMREHYRWDSKTTTRHGYFHFDLEAIPNDWPPQTEWPVVETQPDPVVVPLFRHVLSRLAMHPEWPALRPGADENRLVECLLTALLRPIRAAGGHQRHFPEAVHHALNLLRSTLDEDPHRALSLKQLAQHAGVTRKHLCRLFQQSFGHPPMQTFKLMKLQLALAMLGRSNLAIKQVADRCGFDNPLYFSRCFSQTYGISPSAMRERLLGREPPPRNPLPPEITPRLYW